MRIALLTSDHIRHKYFASVLAEHHEIAIIVSEKKGNEQQYQGNNKFESEVLHNHFSSLHSEQIRYWGDLKYFPESVPHIIMVERGGINSPEIVSRMAECKIEAVAVFGCGIIHDEIIRMFPQRIINAHQGLSPYYRGSGTNFWPFVNNELQYVGVTVHYIDKGIDTGGMICHGRPVIEKNDSMHGIGCKTIEVSANMVSSVITSIGNDDVPASVQQWSGGRLYQRKDFNAQAVQTALRNIDKGMISSYVAKYDQKLHPKIQLLELK